MKPEIAWNAGSLVASLACVGAVAFYLYFPVEQHPTEYRVKTSDAALARARQTSLDAQNVIDGKEWSQDAKALSGQVLSDLSAAADKRKVLVTDLRFDRPVTVVGLKEAPFTAMVEGSFDNVMDFVAGLETQSSRLGMSMLQITSSDQGPGFVKATIRLTAFIKGSA